MKRRPLALPLLAAGLAACTDTPTIPRITPPVKPAREVVAAAPYDLKVGLALAADDARARVIPTLGDAGALHAVDNAFRSLGDAVRANDASAVRSAINQANGTLNALAHSAPNTDPVEVAALRLVVLNADLIYPAG
jgi:hypothetical protein